MPPLPQLAITGSTGAVGGRVARRLDDRSVAQRLLVRDPAKAPPLEQATPVRVASYGDRAGMRAVLDGVHTLFFVSGRESEDRLQQHLTAIDAAHDAGVERIVYLSFLAAAPRASFTLARQHFATEEHIRASGFKYTFLRSSMYADFVPYLTGEDGVIRGPAGKGRLAWVARDDIADVAAEVLLVDEHDTHTYNMTGPQALSLAETADILATVTDRPIRYVQETIEEAWESRRTTGAPDWEIEGWISSYVAVATGEMDVVTDVVHLLAGHEPQELEAFLRANPGLWRHLISP